MMRNLLIDNGNSFCKIALYSSNKIIKTKSIKSISLNEIKQIIKDFPLQNSVISSVIEFPSSVSSYIKSKSYLLEFNHTTPIPIINKYKTKKTLGLDRLSAVIGANSIFSKENILVIDIGTCIKYDFINLNREYLGGSISPGLSMRYEALNTFTGKLPLIRHKNINTLYGNTTEESIITGVNNGIVGEINQKCERYSKEFPGIKILVSGGDYKYFVKQINFPIFAVPNIVLIGLNEILNYNVKKNS